ncbi:isochorismate synthase [Fulvimarina manganoxydans]|uniref:isochorismate synthase n=1 Tax=Fulvimarina manganoxydans TaxID=937218 RepID=A0A1W2ARF0_9HYPH|nr:isochorismate synthase [Fulvimarina manganoxydans]SMC63273.1 isochorismate synthase [Fulvimarina manganoxydans]
MSVASKTLVPAPARHPAAPGFALTTGGRRLIARGLGSRVLTPAAGGEHPDSTFQSAVRDAFAQAHAAGQDRPILVGAIPFDLSQPSSLYVPAEYEWQDIGEDTSPDHEAPPVPALLSQSSQPSEADYQRMVEQALSQFGRSPLRKVVLSVIRELRFDGPIDVDALAARLKRLNATGYHYRVPLPGGGDLVGVTPELLLRKRGDAIETNPLAGSARRDPADPLQDKAIGAALERSKKDLYEHRLVVEAIGAALAPHCRELDIPAGPSLIQTAKLWHLSTRIAGRVTDPSMNALQLACLLHPTPAVCGHPRQEAVNLLRFVERFDRGPFAGMVGWCDESGDGEWLVTLRCGVVDRDRVRLFAGAGIVEGSEPAKEWSEIETKLSTMLTAFGLDDGNRPERP